MDLRKHITDATQVDTAKELVLKSLIKYQPFIFGDDLEVGVGYEIVAGEFKGMVYFPTIDPKKLNPEIDKMLFKGEKDKFTECNQMLRAMYDHFYYIDNYQID